MLSHSQTTATIDTPTLISVGSCQYRVNPGQTIPKSVPWAPARPSGKPRALPRPSPVPRDATVEAYLARVCPLIAKTCDTSSALEIIGQRGEGFVLTATDGCRMILSRVPTPAAMPIGTKHAAPLREKFTTLPGPGLSIGPDLQAVIRRVGTCAPKGARVIPAIRLTWTNGRLVVETNSDDNDTAAREWLPVPSHDASSTSAVFNIDFLRDSLGLPEMVLHLGHPFSVVRDPADQIRHIVCGLTATPTMARYAGISYPRD